MQTSRSFLDWPVSCKVFLSVFQKCLQTDDFGRAPFCADVLKICQKFGEYDRSGIVDFLWLFVVE